MAVSSPSRGSGILALVLVLAAPVAHAQRPLAWTGDGPSATPAVRRVGVPSSVPAGVSVSGEAGYAITEAVFDADGEHHRAFGSIAGAVRPLDWLHIWLRADGRYDVHAPDADGPDDGLQGLPRLGVRAGGSIDPRIAIGVDVERLCRAPRARRERRCARSGARSPRPSVDALTLAVMFGFRFDNPAPPSRGRRPSPRRHHCARRERYARSARVGPVVRAAAEAWRVTLDALVGDRRSADRRASAPSRCAERSAQLPRARSALGTGVEPREPRRAHVGPGRPASKPRPRGRRCASRAVVGRRRRADVEPEPAGPALAGPRRAARSAGRLDDRGARGRAGHARRRGRADRRDHGRERASCSSARSSRDDPHRAEGCARRRDQ
jgi:hypothetical protein